MQLDIPADGPEKKKNKDLQKTKLCIYHTQGLCTLGENCKFAHNVSEMREAPNLTKTQLCKAFMNGYCRNQNCNYAHGEAELVSPPNFKKKLCHWHAKGKCRNGHKCGFAHSISELAEGVNVPDMLKSMGYEREADWDASTVAPSSRHDTDLSTFSGASRGSMPDESLHRMIARRGAAPLHDQVTSMGTAIADLQAKLAQVESGVGLSQSDALTMHGTIEQLSQQYGDVQVKCRQMGKEAELSKPTRSHGGTTDNQSLQARRSRPKSSVPSKTRPSETTIASAWKTYGPRSLLAVATIVLMAAIELYMNP
jgi:hypothetical protein